jgi:hypothetical protein
MLPDGAVFVGLLLTDILSCFGDCEPADGVNLFILSATEAVFLFSAFNRALDLASVLWLDGAALVKLDPDVF